MRCDDYCPRCGDSTETVSHAIFQCPPALQVWALSTTRSRPGIFPIGSIFADMDYLFWRRDSISESNLDRDPFPWLIWYIWKARNDKLFRGIDRDPLELVRYAESECHAWFDANMIDIPTTHSVRSNETQVISLENLCMIDGSWTSTAYFSGYGWLLQDASERSKIMGMRNSIRRETALHSEVEALRWALECMLLHSSCQRFGTDCKDLIAMLREPEAWPAFSTELETIKTLLICFPDFEIIHIPRVQNIVSDFLAKSARAFHRDLCYVGCSIPVWLSRPPQV